MDIQNHKTAGNNAGNFILIFSASNKKWEGEDWEEQKIPESSRKTVLTWSPASKGDCECAKEERESEREWQERRWVPLQIRAPQILGERSGGQLPPIFLQS